LADNKILEEVAPLMQELKSIGYYLSEELIKEILVLAKEKK